MSKQLETKFGGSPAELMTTSGPHYRGIRDSLPFHVFHRKLITCSSRRGITSQDMETTISAIVKYLNESAHLLSQSAPSTASVLNHQVERILQEQSVTAQEIRQSKICSACGHVLLSGSSYSQSIHQRRANHNRNRRSPKTMVLVCHRCNTELRRAIEATNPLQKRQKPVAAAEFIATQERSKSVPQDKVDTKDRRAVSGRSKKMKKMTSLKAILERSRAESKTQGASPFGLDFKDLMKPG